MIRRRVDSQTTIPREHPACRTFGEIRPYVGGYVRVRFWWSEESPAIEVRCQGAEAARQWMARIREGELAELEERHWR
jgi:hypothetical protein